MTRTLIPSSIETLAIGDELLTGTTTDTNSTWVGRKLYSAGRMLSRVTVIPDDSADIEATLIRIGKRASRVVVFGGLGPTTDDVTAAAAASALGCSLIEDPEALLKIEKVCRTRGIAVSEMMRKQAIRPAASDAIPNSVGLAVGFSCTIGMAKFFFLPGVPREMKAMCEAVVLPRLLDGGSPLWHRTWSVFGLPEAQLQKIVAPLEATFPPFARFGFRTAFPENHLTLYVENTSAAAQSWIAEVEPEIDRLLGVYCYGREGKRIEEVVIDLLRAHGMQIAFAESCTAGLAIHRLTRVPGTSEEIWGGFTVYQVDAKRRVLDVHVESPQAAVSAHCSRELAEKGLVRSGVDLCAAITGYMGPPLPGDSDPAGTVYVALAAKGHGIVAEDSRSFGEREREELQWGASTCLLDLVRRYLQRL